MKFFKIQGVYKNLRYYSVIIAITEHINNDLTPLATLSWDLDRFLTSSTVHCYQD